MAKERFDVAAAVEDVKNRCIFLADAVHDVLDATPGKTAQAPLIVGQIMVAAAADFSLEKGLRRPCLR